MRKVNLARISRGGYLPRLNRLVILILAVGIGAVAVAWWTLMGTSDSPLPPAGQASIEAGDPASALFVLLMPSVDVAGELVSLDPVSGASPFSVSTSTDAALAAAPEDGRLYVASGQDTGSQLSVVDASTGSPLAQVGFPDRWMGTLPAYFPTLALSADGRWLFALGHESPGPGQDAYFVRVFDTVRSSFLEEELSLPACVGGILIPGEAILDVACPHSGIVLSTSVGPDGEFGHTAATEVSDQGIASAIRLPGEAGLVVLTNPGRVVRLDRDGLTDLFEIDAAEQGAPVFDALEVSPDGATLYVGLVARREGRIGIIEAYELSSGSKVASAALPDEAEAWTLSIGASGERLYAPSRDAQRVLVFDADGLELIYELDVPGSPAIVVGP